MLLRLRMDAVVNILDVGERQKVVQPVGGVVLRKFNLAGFDALDNADVQAIAHDFHVLFDLVGVTIVEATCACLYRKLRCSG
jgi:hypothetical protein